MNIVVAKFGGTSMGSADSIKLVADIIFSNQKRKVIVVSALSGVTDKLLNLGRLAENNEMWQDEYNELIERHEEVRIGLNLDISLSDYYFEINQLVQGISMVSDFSAHSQDHLLSFGERLSSFILAEFLKTRTEVVLADSLNFIKTDSEFTNATVDWQATIKMVEKNIKTNLAENKIVICAGFVGSDEDGEYTTLSRGGSDYTAAILANILEGDGLEIWTDVDGIMTADPHLISEAKTIESISFNEAAELAYFGAKVLHPKTIQPAVEKNIPVFVLNTFDPKNKGTKICSQSNNNIKSVAYKKNIKILNICSTRMLEASGFLNKIFSLFEEFGVVVDVVSTSEVSVSLTVDEFPPKKLIEKLSQFSTVEERLDRAIICLVGEGIKEQSGVVAKLFQSIGELPIEMISQGASQRNITLVVEESFVPIVIKNIYNTFFNN